MSGSNWRAHYEALNDISMRLAKEFPHQWVPLASRALREEDFKGNDNPAQLLRLLADKLDPPNPNAKSKKKAA